MISTFARETIPAVVTSHAEDCALLRNVRAVLVRAPHVRLKELHRIDSRIAAHLDGLAVAGERGGAACRAGLARAGAGETFALAVRAIEERDDATLDRAVALAASDADARRGLLSAIGWVSPSQLHGIAQGLLSSPEPLRCELGLAACRLQRVDPGPVLAGSVRSKGPLVGLAAVKAASELGRIDLLEDVLGAISSWDGAVAREAAEAACLLGDRGVSLRALELLAAAEGSPAACADPWLILATDLEHGRELVRQMARGARDDAKRWRRAIRAGGLLGDARLVPWLVEQMDDDTRARLAGESFSLITGADLAALDLERKPPEGIPGGPSDDPDDDDVAMDEDDSLPWPDRAKVAGWWERHKHEFPLDQPCFMGGPSTIERMDEVLRTGFQRQRHLAARRRVLLAPGARLFPTCAPAWRQARLLGL